MKRSFKPGVLRVESLEDEDIVLQDQYLPFAERITQRTQVIVAIDEAIKIPVYYRAVIERIMNLSENDEVKFLINSEGGRLDGLVSLLNAIQNTEATTTAEIVCECHSAASILCLNCDNIYVSPYASMLVHNVQFGAVGSGSDVRDRVKYTLDFSERLLRETYTGFLDEKELLEIMNGREMWLSADDIASRLQSRFKYLESLEDKKQSTED